MKRALLILAALALVACVGWTQDIIYKDQATLQWDAVTTDANGDPLLPEDTVTYEVYIYDSALTIDDQNTANLIFIAETAGTEQLIVFPERRNWYAGVRAKIVTGEPVTQYSMIAWSYDSEAVADVPFGYQPLGGVVPAVPDNLRDSGT